MTGYAPTMDEILKEISNRYDLIEKCNKDDVFGPGEPVFDYLSAPPRPIASTPLPYFNQSLPPAPVIQNHALPKVPCFSGDTPVPKGEVEFIVWRNEIQCLVGAPGMTLPHILQVLRGSLRGTARRMVVPLGNGATFDQVLNKLETYFGDSSSKEELLASFFSSFQQPSESITDYACRLEASLQVIIEKGDLPVLARNDLLRHKFWTGLSSANLKAQTRHKYDYVKDYDLLLREVRQVDKELNKGSSQLRPKVSHNPQVDRPAEDPAMSALTSRMASLEAKVSSWESLFDKKFAELFKKIDSKVSSPSHDSHTPPHYTPPVNPYQSHPARGTFQARGTPQRGRGNNFRGSRGSSSGSPNW